MEKFHTPNIKFILYSDEGRQKCWISFSLFFSYYGINANDASKENKKKNNPHQAY